MVKRKKKTRKKVKRRKAKVKRKKGHISKLKKEKFQEIQSSQKPKKKSSFLPTLLVILLILVAGFVYFQFLRKDVLEEHPEIMENNKIMEFLNKYEKRTFKAEIKKEFLYITIWSKDKKNCIIAVENTDEKVVQVIEPNGCDKKSLKEGLSR